MTLDQMMEHLRQLQGENAEKYKRAVTLAAFQRAIYEAFVHHQLCDQDILALLVNSLIEMAEAKGLSETDLQQEIKRGLEIRALVARKAEGSVQ